MFKLTTAAADQVRVAAKQGESDGLALRIAAREMEDGGIDYTMGFDVGLDSDVQLKIEGVAVIFDATQKTMLDETVLDFVKLDSGEESFVFIDPTNKRHQED